VRAIIIRSTSLRGGRADEAIQRNNQQWIASSLRSSQWRGTDDCRTQNN